MWAGLGYYRRARMLHAGAKYVMEKYDGELPSSVEALLTIPGIGRYTAGSRSPSIVRLITRAILFRCHRFHRIRQKGTPRGWQCHQSDG